MNKIIPLIIISILCSYPTYDFHIHNVQTNLKRSNGNFPDSNGIIDIESNAGSEYIWMSTGAGLGRIDIGSDFIFDGVDDSNLPAGGNPALFIEDNIILVSGVTSEYVAALESYKPKGTGIGYSLDSGFSWLYMPQPICDDCTSIPWGTQELNALAVTTDINNVSYDLGLKDNFIYAASWAGGLRRFDYTLDNPDWEIIPLPLDSSSYLYCNIDIDCNEETQNTVENCNLIDVNNYELNPRDPEDGGHHNHKAFSVLGTENFLWVGTAYGINRGIINDDCINWEHQTTLSGNGLSGNWIVGIEEQLFDSFNRVWAITWVADQGELNSIGYTDDYGQNWNDIKYFSDQNIKIYNLDFNGDMVYAASEEGLFYSSDLVHWEKINRNWKDSNTGDVILDNTVYSVLSKDNLFIGTGDGIIHRNSISNNNTIYRFWNNSAKSNSEDLGFSVYPNPFFISRDGLLNGEGHVRFIYSSSQSSKFSEINIYDFAMNPIASLSDEIQIGDEAVVIWDGRSDSGNRVVNGTYFCKLTVGDKSYWTKLLVIY